LGEDVMTGVHRQRIRRMSSGTKRGLTDGKIGEGTEKAKAFSSGAG
jgi:hypothetical protein